MGWEQLLTSLLAVTCCSQCFSMWNWVLLLTLLTASAT